MSEEEQEAIEQIKYLIKFTKELHIYKTENKAYKIVLNLIDKLKKENEELKEQRDNAIKLRNELIEEQKITCISKNKIRTKIKELDNETGIGFELDKDEINGARVVLKELLGE